MDAKRLMRLKKTELKDLLVLKYPWRAKGMYGKYTKKDIVHELLRK